jgi:hypothetical protein
MLGDVSELMIPDRRQLLLMDGTQQALDLVSKAAMTLSGGVGGAWPGDESNWRRLLSRGGVWAPIIGPAVDNLLSDNAASMETDASAWASLNAAKLVLSSYTSDAWHGSKCLAGTGGSSGGADQGASCDVTTLTAPGNQYTASLWLKAGNAGAIGEQFRVLLYDNVAGETAGTTITLSANWQRSVATKTFDATSTIRMIYAKRVSDLEEGDVVLIDGAQIESGAVANDFALGARSASACTILMSALGLTPGQDFTTITAYQAPWHGGDGAFHTLWDMRDAVGGGDIDGQCLVKDQFNRMWYSASNASIANVAYASTSSANLPANQTNLIITRCQGNTLKLSINGNGGYLTSGTPTREPRFGNSLAIGVYINLTTGPLGGAIIFCVLGTYISDQEEARIAAAAAWPRRYRRQT